jgi:integrase
VSSRERVLSDREIAALMAVLDAETYPIGPLVKLLLLLGQRRSEVAESKWAEFDFTTKVWRSPAARSKNNRENPLPLVDDVVAILRGLPRFESSDYVFTFDGGQHPVTGFGPSKKRIDKAMAAALGEPVKRWTLHDLRRSVATNLQKLGVRLEVTEAVLNHVSGSRGGIVGVYQRHDWAAEKRQALEAWAKRLREIASGEAAAANVLAFAKSKA